MEEPRYEVETVSPLESDKLIEISQQAEKRIEAVRKIKTMALRLTNAHDWTDQGGKPYLQVSGSEKIARLFGISWRFIGEILRKDEESGHFSFEVPMEFVMSGASVEFRGSRSSRDPFFSKKHGMDIPPSDIDRTDVMKAAITNTIGNGITRLLGIRNLTWSDLEESGIRQEDVGKVEYRRKGEAPKSNGQQQQHTIQDPRAPASDKQKEAIKNIGKGLSLTEEGIKDRCFAILQRVVGDINTLTKGEASIIIEQFQKERDIKRGNQ